MEDFQAAEETAFVVDEVSNVVKEAMDRAIGGGTYQHSKVNQWTTNVAEETSSQLSKLGEPCKYTGSCPVRWEDEASDSIARAFGPSV
ncbi:dynein light chain Tctex-type 1-like [Phyllostomus hastatus]|uniref:dynein light chain Tctex-type 1-like n=1 Tax=Phyllostomus hastatus TaxID=9423 RepID=UPI001E685BC8|nr:dynein light chain Tctex-type 1-like [Phyllostomus hastatus]